MKFHDAVRKHIRVLDDIQRKMKTRDDLNTKMKMSKSSAKQFIEKQYPNVIIENEDDSVLFKLNGKIIGQYDLNTGILYYQFKKSE